jgi:hypothetical protein
VRGSSLDRPAVQEEAGGKEPYLRRGPLGYECCGKVALDAQAGEHCVGVLVSTTGPGRVSGG